MTDLQPPPHECTVLFADLVGSTQLYERVGDSSAFQLVDGCLQAMRDVVERTGGVVVKHTGDGLMAVFEEPDRAVDTATKIHHVVRSRPLSSGHRLAVRIGFHYGPVVNSGTDVFGETVNLSARLVEIASPGRAITTQETVRRLSPEWQALLRPLQPRLLRGVSRPTELSELVCEAVGDLTVVQAASFETEDDPELRMYQGEQLLVLNTQKPLARIGRDSSSDLRIADSRASRQHAEIGLRGDKFVLVDRSTNGTFVVIEGEKEFVVSREEVVLHGRGHFALGRSCVDNPHTISFICL